MVLLSAEVKTLIYMKWAFNHMLYNKYLFDAFFSAYSNAISYLITRHEMVHYSPTIDWRHNDIKIAWEATIVTHWSSPVDIRYSKLNSSLSFDTKLFSSLSSVASWHVATVIIRQHLILVTLKRPSLPGSPLPPGILSTSSFSPIRTLTLRKIEENNF